MTFGEKVIHFYKNLQLPTGLPEGVEILDPFADDTVKTIVEHFNNKFFNDTNPRTFLIGINPGRLGGGTTGIPFTDPIRLEEELGIENSFDRKQELSSNFVYQMIDRLGGAEFFYSKFYFTSACPVGFTKDGKNLNYYDIKELQEALDDYNVDQLQKQKDFGANDIAYSIGQGKNVAYLKQLNKKHKFFKEIRPLPHPRWVMQYRLKRLGEFLELYKKELLG
ncbi:uracil-DNA glycosylase family protein [Fulvivirga lutea]|uniref:DUF4918 family protein n=1 Tax=Fulvivirga lutea TaxID=2810512 RepID=A0A975A268_9BACT|nr:uracil-DNA glycosylase family protein [Fulvivirga lutea]QSE98232.1 DUF4918 family protein [Fulvivirga lutea]